VVYYCLYVCYMVNVFKLFCMIEINHDVTQSIDGVSQSYVVVKFIVGLFVHMFIYRQG
jgi:Ca2+/Na+ antiporter